MSVSAVHIRTSGFLCRACPEVVRRTLKGVPGVHDVVAVESLGLTSVLFDPEVIATSDLQARIESLGFTTELNSPDRKESE